MILRSLLLALFALPAIAQSTPPPAFIAADIHASPHHAQPFFYTPPIVQSRYVIHDATMVDLIYTAYGLLDRDNVQGDPSWLEQDHFDIVAKIPPNTSQATLKLMLRTLLAERFQLVVHTGTASAPAFVMSVAKGGPKLKESAALPEDSPLGPPPLLFVVVPPAVRLPGRYATMAELASVFQRGALDRPVVDRTGLPGRYDFDLEFTPDDAQFSGALAGIGGDSPLPGLFTAIQQQLGLRLDATKGPVDVLVVDRAERPSAN